MPVPIPWNEVALVGFHEGRAVIISSMEPRVIFETLADLARGEDDSHVFGEDDEVAREAVAIKISELDWKLYYTQDAKDVFCGKVLPKQLELPLKTEEA